MIYSSPVRSFTRLTLYILWVSACIPVQAVALLFKLPISRRFPMTAHRGCVRIMGAKLDVRGQQVRKGAVLFVVNHSSYLDVTILGSLIRGSFVAKSEVAKWPVYGVCAKLQRTVFIDRRARFVASQADMLRKRLEKGDRLILFPEGTSNDGNRVLPFRSALFSAAELKVGGRPIRVQPVSLAYTHLDGMPMGRHLRPFYAWYGDMDLASHLWQMFGMGRPRIVVRFHEPVTLDRFESRKDLARYCQAVIAAGVSEALTGREQPILLPAPIAETVPGTVALPEGA